MYIQEETSKTFDLIVSHLIFMRKTCFAHGKREKKSSEDKGIFGKIFKQQTGFGWRNIYSVSSYA